MNKNNSIQLLIETLVLIDGAYAPATIRAYKYNFERFIFYCDSTNANALPADSETIAKFIQKLTASNLKSASIRLAVASISTIHKLNQLTDPTQFPPSKLELRRMHRALGRESKQALGINALTLEKMIASTKDDLRGLRDKALLLTAYDSLCRRSELSSLRFNDIEYSKEFLPIRIKLRKSKTDQEGAGQMIKLTTKTQVAIKHWIDCAKIKEGLLFRGIKNNGDILKKLSPGQINRIYKRLAAAANISREDVANISGHSIRVGAAQDIMLSGASLPTLMIRGRWSKPDTALRYVEQCT